MLCGVNVGDCEDVDDCVNVSIQSNLSRGIGAWDVGPIQSGKSVAST